MCKEKTQFVLKKFCRHLSVSLLNLFLALEAFKRTCITRFTEKYINVQLSLSSRGLHGGAYFSDVSGWNSIPIIVPGPCECLEWHRLLGFCLTITFCLNPAHLAVSLWNCRVCWRICLFYSYRFVTNGKYLWSPRREILQFQWKFQLEMAWCAKIEQKVVVR